MPDPARTQCLICGSSQLRPFLNLSETGTPHGAAEHNFTRAYQTFAICDACGHGFLEVYAHDCFHYYGDEDGDMYWWYVPDPIAMNRLHDLMAQCPDPLSTACDCALHRGLCHSGERLWGGVKHAVNPIAKIAFAWALLEEQPDRAVLKVVNQRGLQQAS